jgi:hypothetical protein
MRSAIAVVLWLIAAGAHAQAAPASKASSASSTRAHKRSSAAAKPSHSRSAAHEHAAPKTETAPKVETEKADASRRPEAPVETKPGQAAQAPKAEGKTDAKPAAPVAPSDADVRTEGGTQVKMMEFSGLDIEGQLKTPQMLYFLNRLRAEFGHPRLPHRSFMPELERSTKEGSF